MEHVLAVLNTLTEEQIKLLATVIYYETELEDLKDETKENLIKEITRLGTGDPDQDEDEKGGFPVMYEENGKIMVVVGQGNPGNHMEFEDLIDSMMYCFEDQKPFANWKEAHWDFDSIKWDALQEAWHQMQDQGKQVFIQLPIPMPDWDNEDENGHVPTKAVSEWCIWDIIAEDHTITLIFSTASIYGSPGVEMITGDDALLNLEEGWRYSEYMFPIEKILLSESNWEDVEYIEAYGKGMKIPGEVRCEILKKGDPLPKRATGRRLIPGEGGFVFAD